MKTEYERWSSKVAFGPVDSCWNWIGSKYRKGYGHFRRMKDNKWRMEKAHRYSYEYFNNVSRDSMDGMNVCHTCDNPSCVNPHHLFLGTTQDNTDDKVNKGRHSFGRATNQTLLSSIVASQIRSCKRDNPNLTYKQLGKLFNTSDVQAFRVVKNQIWKASSKEL